MATFPGHSSTFYHPKCAKKTSGETLEKSQCQPLTPLEHHDTDNEKDAPKTVHLHTTFQA
jgi:hypothetical protein